MSQPASAATSQGRALRGTVLLGARQLAISLLSVAAVGTLSGLLSPAEFAIYGYAASIMLVAAGIGDLGTAASLIRGEADRSELGGTLSAQLLIWGGLAFAGCIAVVASGAYDLSTGTALAMAAGFVLLCVQTVPTAILERDLRFGAIAFIEVAQRALFLGLLVGLAVGGLEPEAVPVALIAAAVFGCLAVSVGAAAPFRPTRPRLLARESTFSSQWWRGRVYAQANYAVYPVVGGLLLSGHDIGLVLWALAVTQVPALLAPMAARALLPSVAQSSVEDQVATSSLTLRVVLLVSLPLVAAIGGCAGPLVDFVFGSKWSGAVDVLRLECVTTALGIALTAGVPIFYLVLPPRTVTRIIAAWTLIAWVGTPVAIAAFGLLGPSITVILAAGLTLVAFDRLLHRTVGYSPAKDLVGPLVALALAGGVGWLASPVADGVASTVALCAGIAVLQLALAVCFGLWRDVVRILDRFRGRGAQPGVRATT